jgi:hypothetical protein
VHRNGGGDRVRAQPVGHGPALHVRQFEVERDRGRPVALRQFQSLHRAARHHHPKAALARQVLQRAGEHRVVLDHQQQGEVAGCGAVQPRGYRLHRLCVLGIGGVSRRQARLRQVKGERAALVLFAFHAQLAIE